MGAGFYAKNTTGRNGLGILYRKCFWNKFRHHIKISS